jgi:hypothetical protein
MLLEVVVPSNEFAHFDTFENIIWKVAQSEIWKVKKGQIKNYFLLILIKVN